MPTRRTSTMPAPLGRWIEEAGRNLRYAVRTLRRAPAFTVAALATIALCIGANAAIFSVIDAVLLRPLPYPRPGRLAAVATLAGEHGTGDASMSQDGRTFLRLRDHGGAFLDVAATSGGFTGVNLAADDGAEYVRQQRVSAGFFRVLGIAPRLGRGFEAAEDRQGGPAAVILSDELWRRAFHGDLGVVGRTVLLRGEPHTVVGVMPAGFQGLFPADLWTPLRPSAQGEGEGSNYLVIARLRDGVTWTEADARTAALGRDDVRRDAASTRTRSGLVTLQHGVSTDLRTPLLVLWGAVLLVLLIGCANVAGLMLGRGTMRAREIATRAALGAGRGAVVRQLLTESVLLAATGTAIGVLLGLAGIRLLGDLAAREFGIWAPLALDARVLAATAGLSAAGTLLFGVYPAFRTTRLDVRAVLVEGGSRGIAGGRSHRPRAVLVAAEVALGVVMLVSAGLLVRTFLHLRTLPPGFDATGVVAAGVSLQDARYRTTDSANRLFTQSLRRIRQVPGVEAAAVGLHVPYERWLNTGMRRLDGPDTGHHITNLNYVTPQYFRALRIPVVEGRTFTDADTATTVNVAVVNSAFVRRYFGEGERAVGRFLEPGGGKPTEIVGVVGDVQQRSGWGGFGPIAPAPAVFVPAAQVPGDLFALVHTWFAPSWIVRAEPGVPVVHEIRHALASVDSLLPVATFHTMDEVRSETLGAERFQALLLGLLAGLALVLAAVGIGGLIASSVADRTREMGIRLALGATPLQTMVAAARPGLAMSAMGLVSGLAAARAISRVFESLVFGVATADPVTFAGVAVLLLAVSAAASLAPTLRLLRLSPADTLRDE